jgi:hypothetical protein
VTAVLDQLKRFTAGTVLLAGVLTLAGCTSDPDAPDPAGQPAAAAASLPADAGAALTQAVSRLGTESARFTIALGEDETVSGVIDPATGAWEMTGRAFVARRLGADLYLKLTAEPRRSVFPGQYADDLGKWVHQPVPAGPGSAHAFTKDFPWEPARTAAAMTGPARIADHIFQGRLPDSTPCVAELDQAGRFSRVSAMIGPNAPTPTRRSRTTC